MLLLQGVSDAHFIRSLPRTVSWLEGLESPGDPTNSEQGQGQGHGQGQEQGQGQGQGQGKEHIFKYSNYNVKGLGPEINQGSIFKGGSDTEGGFLWESFKNNNYITMFSDDGCKPNGMVRICL